MTFYVFVDENDEVHQYFSLSLLKKAHGGDAPYQTFTREQLDRAGERIRGAVFFYGHNGRAIIRDSEENDTVIQTLDEIKQIDSQLEQTDRKFGSRASRGLLRKIARQNSIAPGDDDLIKLDEAETRAGELRSRRAALRAGLAGEAPQ